MMKTVTLLFVAVALAACDTTEPLPLPLEYAWAGSVAANGLHTAVADSTDSVTVSVYAVLDEDGKRVEGVLTIMNDTTLAYDPYEVLVDGFMTRDPTGTPEAMLAEFARYDGARCRIHGLIDSLGWWNSEVGCGGSRVDSVKLHPFKNGYIGGKVTSGTYSEDPAEGVRVWYCEMNDDEDDIVGCHGATYSGSGGAFRAEVPSGRWFVTFSIWDPIFDKWDHCRENLSDDARLGRKVTVRKARVTDASANCPWFI